MDARCQNTLSREGTRVAKHLLPNSYDISYDELFEELIVLFTWSGYVLKEVMSFIILRNHEHNITDMHMNDPNCLHFNATVHTLVL